VRLGLTQPGLSRRIHELERAVGVPLLVRSARGVEPTAAGLVLRGEAVEMLSLAGEIVIHARRAEREVRGKCELGVVPPAIARGIVSNLLQRLATGFPDVELVVAEIPTPRQPTALLAHEIDLGIAHAYPGLIVTPALTGVRLVDDAIDCALVGTEHPLAGRSSISGAELSDVPLLFMPRDFHPAFYDNVMEALARIGLTPRIDATFDGLRTVWSLAARGMGWSIGSHSQRQEPPPDLVAVPVEDLHIPWGLEVLWRVGETSDAVHAALWILRDAHDTASRCLQRMNDPRSPTESSVGRA
jgi:DNA-binding transcriptional LysR family regulator